MIFAAGERGHGEKLRIALCFAIPLISVWAAHPFSGVGFDDDWSYAQVALNFAETGRLRYNGWGPAMQIVQAVWAAGWIRGLGFSFDLLRLITLPFSVGFVWFTYALGKKAGLRPGLACFGAMVVGTSPLFVPLAASFMTEPYACFFTAACIYAAMCSAEAGTTTRAAVWLWIVSIAGLIGGADRQSVWTAPLALIPYLVWMRRRERSFVVQAIAAYVLLAACIAILVTRFSQLYPGLDLQRQHATSLFNENLLPTFGRLLSLLLTGLQVVFPALCCFVPCWRKMAAPKLLGAVVLSAFAVAGCILAGGGAAPFASSVLSGYGLLPAGGDGLGERPALLTPAVRIALGVLIAFSGIVSFWGALPRRLPAIPGMVLLISSCAYLPVLFPGAITGFIHDRYVLPLIPALVIAVLCRFQAIGRSIPVAAWTCLCAFAVYGIVITHDYASASRARVQAAQSLERSGVSRDEISAGLEYDGWTQLQIAGTVAPIRYGDHFEWNTTDRFWFWTYATSLRPQYVAVTGRASDPAEDQLPKITYTAWTPPFRRAVIVRRRESLPKGPVCRAGSPCVL